MILIAVGANLPGRHGSPLMACERAVGAIREALPGRRLARSRWFRSAPVPASDQPDYVNGVVRLEGSADPAWLLALLQRIEAEAGRKPGERNAARVLDLDILDIDGTIRDAPDPVLPHPRLADRAFVLWPLRDVVPDWVHPRLGERVGALVAGKSKEGQGVSLRLSADSHQIMLGSRARIGPTYG